MPKPSNTKRNFEIFKAPDFIAAALLHLPPKGQQTVRYYGVYSNKTRGLAPLHKRGTGGSPVPLLARLLRLRHPNLPMTQSPNPHF